MTKFAPVKESYEISYPTYEIFRFHGTWIESLNNSPLSHFALFAPKNYCHPLKEVTKITTKLETCDFK